MDLLEQAFRIQIFVGLLILSTSYIVKAQDVAHRKPFSYADLQHLNTLREVKISPDGHAIVYSVHPIDVIHDGYDQTSWIIRLMGDRASVSLPRIINPSWSPDGRSLAVVTRGSGKSTVQLLRADTLEVMRTFDVPALPGNLIWSPNGESLAFTLAIREQSAPSFLQEAVDDAVGKLEKPKEAEWAVSLQITQSAHYREDDGGWLEGGSGNHHLFVLTATSGTLRQVGKGSFDDDEPAWSADSQTLFFTSDRRPGWEHMFPVRSIYRTDMAGNVTRLTQGDDFYSAPRPSPDGKWIAFLQTPDRQASYTPSRLYIMHLDGTQKHQVAADLDRDLSSASWSADGQGLYAKFEDHGIGHVGLFGVDGQNKVLVSGLNGTFSVSGDGTIAYSGAQVDRPNELMLQGSGETAETLTSLNPFLKQRQLGKLVHLVAHSNSDDLPIEGWALLPPGSSGRVKLPMILVLHGGPFGDDGPNWDSERELFAAAGYVVVYGNYRGSTSYGAAFAEPANYGFPDVAYGSVMSLVDEGIRKGFVDPNRLFVTGASAGAELTAWITGKTHRFRAAAAEKPTINEMSEALLSDQYLAAFLIYQGAPWTHEKELWAHSPLSLADSVTTPTLFIVGEKDFRTPLEESLQMYDALQLRGIPTALLRAPGASHGSLRSRPSQNTAIVAAMLAWFRKYDTPDAVQAGAVSETP